MNSIKILDVTLRDGGCVNDFNFGQAYMDTILSHLEASGVDYIELGYIDEKNGSEQGRTQYRSEQVIPTYFLKIKKPGITYVAMIDYGKFDIDKLQPRTDEGIDGIRMAFHKKNWNDAISLGRKIIDKGYMFFIQPMLTMRYTDAELIELIDTINNKLPDAAGFYAVDSFGEMRNNDVIRLMHIIDHNLLPSMALGFHSHNNLQLSYSNAMTLLNFPTNRNLMLDSSVMGMGKGAGNLNTELLMEHLNLYYGKSYKTYPLMELIDQVINVIHKDLYWGYAVEYYLSSINRCTPSYASHFYNKHMLPIDQVAELLGMIAEEKKISFDRNYAEQLYLDYNAKKSSDDTETIKELREKLTGKRVLLIAPGKSITTVWDKITDVLLEDVVSIALNNFEFNTDYILTTRTEIFNEALTKDLHIIVPSNVAKNSDADNVNIIDYEKWIIKGEKTYDSSGVMSLLLMKALGVKEIMLAGFDGFSANINENYYDKTMRKPVTDEQAKRRNKFYRELINEINKTVNMIFITESVYKD